MLDGTGSQKPHSLTLRKPRANDGSEIWSLVRRCAPLDENSMYCNLVQCDHFADTCVVADSDQLGVAGWISGHVIPTEPDTMFVWQVAVDPAARGMGLGGKMLSHLLARAADFPTPVTKIKTTITEDNAASWALFRRFAERAGGTLTHAPHFSREAHFDGQHATEHMLTIVFPDATAQDAPQGLAA